MKDKLSLCSTNLFFRPEHGDQVYRAGRSEGEGAHPHATQAQNQEQHTQQTSVPINIKQKQRFESMACVLAPRKNFGFFVFITLKKKFLHFKDKMPKI